MSKSKQYHITQHVLWDNLKRAANIHLREIEALPLSQRAKVFESAPFGRIQKLLTMIGKELYRIVLHQVIEDELQKSGKEFTTQVVDDVLADFSFFFFPGYTTQNRNNRIFIEGLKLDGYQKQRRFFSGIGYKNVRLQNKVVENNNLQLFRDFLLGRSTKHRKLFQYKGSLFYKDNPSTMAYNLSLNKFYFAHEYPNTEPPFQAGSTHFWKSQQTLDGKYYPFKLKKDYSELRILHIGVMGEDDVSVQNGQNKISILLDQNKLHLSGQTIAYYLNRDIIPIRWDHPSHKEAYINWCDNVVFPIDLSGSRITLRDFQRAQQWVYSYWLCETFSGKTASKNYSVIQQNLKKIGYDFIAENRIKSYKDYIKNNHKHKKHIYKTYFSNWYTLFLESYGANANLGTIMLFTNHRLSPKFLNFCTNFIKGIYNELRLAEALALRQKKDFRSINHHHNKIINAFRYYIDGTFEKEEQFSEDILTYYINLIEGFMNVEEMIQTQPEDLMQKLDLNLVEDVEKMLGVYKYFTKNYNRFAYLLGKLKVDETHFDAYVDLKFLTIIYPDNKKDFEINYFAPIVQLLLKDLVENVIVHAKLGAPKSVILFHNNKELNKLTIEFRTNKWPTQRILNKMNKNSFGELSKGWTTINNVIDTANAFSNDIFLKINLPLNVPEDKAEFFWIKLDFINGNN